MGRKLSMCDSSSSPAAQFAQSHSIAALLKAALDPAADKNRNGIPDKDEKATPAAKAAGTGLVVDRSA